MKYDSGSAKAFMIRLDDPDSRDAKLKDEGGLMDPAWFRGIRHVGPGAKLYRAIARGKPCVDRRDAATWMKEI